jgi:isoquinoline 1-oxidoreductase beta subunit
MNAKLKHASRRQFLKVSAAVGGGLIVGLYLPGRDFAAERKAVVTNAWVRIAPDNTITLISHRNEMGQDVYTSLALLVAEELGVDVSKVTIEQAPVEAVYGNALLGGAQITGGSTSVRDAWTKLREAGATARVLLVTTAANRWKVPVAECTVKDGSVVHPSGKRLSYGELAEAAAKLPAPKTVELKKRAAFTQIGKQRHRLDSPAKARGQTIFGLDVVQPGMVHASLEQCPVLGGKVAGVDDSRARTIKGVIAVVNIGEGVAVVADRYWTAKTAREALEISWDYGPAATLTTERIYATLKDGANNDGAVAKQAGDADRAMKTATKTLTPYTSHSFSRMGRSSR